MRDCKKVLIVLGPGRSGTTSLFHSFKVQSGYAVAKDKESGVLSFGYKECFRQIERSPPGTVFVEMTPSNLLSIKSIIENTRAKNIDVIGYFVIRRSVVDRMYSLYAHHINLGNIACSFNEYIDESHRVATLKRLDGDLVYSGLAEYNENLLAKLDRDKVWVLDFDDLFTQANSVLKALNLPEIREQQRNKSYIPKYKWVHLVVLQVYISLKLQNVGVLEKIKSIYKSRNSNAAVVEISDHNSALLMDYEFAWGRALSEFSNV